MKNLFSLQSGKSFEAFDQAGENEAPNDEKGNANHEEAPAGDAANVFVVELLPVFNGGVEIVEEVEGQTKVHHCGEAEGAEEE